MLIDQLNVNLAFKCPDGKKVLIAELKLLTFVNAFLAFGRRTSSRKFQDVPKPQFINQLLYTLVSTEV